MLKDLTGGNIILNTEESNFLSEASLWLYEINKDNTIMMVRSYFSLFDLINNKLGIFNLYTHPVAVYESEFYAYDDKPFLLILKEIILYELDSSNISFLTSDELQKITKFHAENS